MGLLNFLKKIEPDKKKSPFLHTLYDGFFTFAYAPNTTTQNGVHVRDGMDLKRTMVFVVLGNGNNRSKSFVGIGRKSSSSYEKIDPKHHFKLPNYQKRPLK